MVKTTALIEADPDQWSLYHSYYREARETWPEVPAEHVAILLQTLPTNRKIGDFGCGECLLRDALPDHEVLGFDHVAIDETVTACDMASTPLEDSSLGARVLEPYGLLFVAEPAKRWEEGALERAVQKAGFDVLPSVQRDDFRYVRAIKTTEGRPPTKA